MASHHQRVRVAFSVEGGRSHLVLRFVVGRYGEIEREREIMAKVEEEENTPPPVCRVVVRSFPRWSQALQTDESPTDPV